MALALGLVEIDELGAGMAGRTVVDVLDLARLEAELDMQLGLLEHRLYGSERRRRLVVHPLAAQLVAGMDLAQRQPRLDRAVAAALEERSGEGGGDFVGLRRAVNRPQISRNPASTKLPYVSSSSAKGGTNTTHASRPRVSSTR